VTFRAKRNDCATWYTKKRNLSSHGIFSPQPSPRLPFHLLITPLWERRRTHWPTSLSVFTRPFKRRSAMLFPMPHPRRFYRLCSCCSFLPGRAPSCWPAHAQQTQQFTSITSHFETHVRSMFINIASLAPTTQQTQQFTSITPHFETHVRSMFINIPSPAPASLPAFTAGLKPLCAELHSEEHTWPLSVYLLEGFKMKSYSTL
jgi:hypothetical protein